LELCRGFPVIAVNDAYRLLPFANVLYACDADWWDIHRGTSDFRGEKWSSQGANGHNDKIEQAKKYGLRLIAGAEREGFSLAPGLIHYGSNSGFQAVNLAMQFGATRILLIGFDMCAPSNGPAHFFGNHPRGLVNMRDYERFIPAFEVAAKMLPNDTQIINCSATTALRCFPRATLADALSDAT
jgi:hypothetical protein